MKSRARVREILSRASKAGLRAVTKAGSACRRVVTRAGSALGEILRDTWAQMRRAQLLTVASSLAYVTILSVVPMLAVSFAIFKAFGGLERLYSTLEPLLLSNLAEGSSAQVIPTLEKFLSNAHASAFGIGGFLGLVATSMSMLNSIENAINRVWGAPARKKILQKIATYWLFITLGPLAGSIAIGFVSGQNLPIATLFPSGTGVFLLTIAFFSCIFRWVPNTEVHWRYALAAGTATAMGLSAARGGYSLYTHQVVTYNKIYGSLGAIPILILWIYIVWAVVLTGAALSAALQHRLENKRSTSGGRPGGRA